MADKATQNLKSLAINAYPGRGLAIGKSKDGKRILLVYWLMGRSKNSRNRKLILEGNIVKAVAYDESKVEDPSLIIYNAMKIVKQKNDTYHIVSNGDQTDTIVEFMERGSEFESALRSRTFEPDAPNYTSRISACVNGANSQAIISIIRRDPAGTSQHDFNNYKLRENGVGYCIHTYQAEGMPLPPFSGEPYLVPLGYNTEDTAQLFWDKLNKNNKISIVVKGIRIDRQTMSYDIINKLS